MGVDRHRLDDRQIAELERFIEGVDRGKADIFVGRDVELRKVASRLRTVEGRKDEQWPGQDLTLVFQGAPGAGKSALLEKLASNFPAGRRGGPIAVRFDSDDLCLPEDRLQFRIAERLARVRPQTFGRWRKTFPAGRIGAGNTYLDVQLDQSNAEERRLGKLLATSPVLLLFDEIQASAMAASGGGAANLERNLRWLHLGSHGLAMFPVFGGLANSGDLLRESGLARLSSESEFTLPRFSNETSNELARKFADIYLSTARPPAEMIETWSVAMLRDSHGWPMHCRNFLNALGSQIRECDWRPAEIDLDQARLKAAASRSRYYGHRLAGPLTDRQGLVSVVLEQLKRTGPMARESMIELIRDADNQGRSNPGLEGDPRWTVPCGTDFPQIFDAMLHSGIVQNSSLEYGFECSIPSLGSYMAARAACPVERLHGAIMNGAVDVLEATMSGCTGPGLSIYHT